MIQCYTDNMKTITFNKGERTTIIRKLLRKKISENYETLSTFTFKNRETVTKHKPCDGHVLRLPNKSNKIRFIKIIAESMFNSSNNDKRNQIVNLYAFFFLKRFSLEIK